MYFSDWELHNDAKIGAWLLWEYNMDKFDWQLMRGEVVERVIERGSKEDYYGMFNLYGGVKGVKQIIINDVPFLYPHDIAYVEALFNVKKEDLSCYKSQQLRRKLLAS